MQTMFELSDKLMALKQAKADLAEQEKELKAKLSAVEMELADLMLENELQRFNRNGVTFSYKVTPQAGAKAGMQPEVAQWLKENGYAAIVKEAVNHMTFRATVREMIEAGGVPDGLAEMISVYEQVSVGTLKTK